jgi:macrolide phosphotransferase
MSLGGLLVQIIALEHPSRVLTLALLASALLGPRDVSVLGMARIVAHHAQDRTVEWAERDKAQAEAKPPPHVSLNPYLSTMTTLSTTDAILAAAREHGVPLAAATPELDLSGADFFVVHAMDEEGVPWVVRAPRRADVVERAARERRALVLVAPRLPVAVPEWRLFSPEVIGYPRLSGDPAAVVDLAAGGYVWRFDEKAPPSNFLDSFADTVAALHGVDLAAARGAKLPVRTPADVRAEFVARAERAREELNITDGVWKRWQVWLQDDTYWPEHSALVHGDLHPGHLLINDEHCLVGLLDWTEAHVGDPATDFALLYATLGRGALARLLARYEAAGRTVWPRMEEHVVETWAAYPAILVEFALLTGEDGPRLLAQHLVDVTAREVSGA